MSACMIALCRRVLPIINPKDSFTLEGAEFILSWLPYLSIFLEQCHQLLPLFLYSSAYTSVNMSPRSGFLTDPARLKAFITSRLRRDANSSSSVSFQHPRDLNRQNRVMGSSFFFLSSTSWRSLDLCVVRCRVMTNHVSHHLHKNCPPTVQAPPSRLLDSVHCREYVVSVYTSRIHTIVWASCTDTIAVKLLRVRGADSKPVVSARNNIGEGTVEARSIPAWKSLMLPLPRKTRRPHC